MIEGTSDRILFLLKTRGPLTAAALARQIGITPMGVRQHLARLALDELVAHVDERRSVGRPKRHWQLTAKAEARFPDSHAQVTVELLGAVGKLFGEAGLDRLIAERERETLVRYASSLSRAKSLSARVRALAGLRNEEGYLSEWRSEKDGSFLLIENHCPICAAAKTCQGFCRSELDIFRALLPGNDVERVDHLLAGGRRCAYRIAPRRAAASADQR
jgi:predicted ArsR family transcriptional regulator